MNKFITTLILLLVYINSSAQTADFTYTPSSGTLCNPQTVTFTQSATGSSTPTYLWNFGNGQTGNQPSHTITYEDPGTYTVKFTAVFNNIAVTTTKTITVRETPDITLTATKFSLCKPDNITFTANGSSNITSWLWTFDDGSPPQTTSGNTLTHFFPNFDTVRVIVRGSTAEGCSMTAALNISIAKFPLTATVTPKEGCKPVLASFQLNATLLPGDTRQNVLWQWGDGTPNASNNFGMFNHSYNTTQTITNASVTVTTTQGCTNQYVFPPFGYGTPPTNTQAYTTALRDTFCGSETVQFFASATNANLYTWNFGGGVIRTSTTNTIFHRFSTLGTKNAIVTPSFNGCPGLKDTVKVFIKGVIAYYDITNTCSQKNSYVFQNNSLGNISKFEWTFSDTPGFIDSVNFSAPHTFPTAGTFNTHLLLRDYTTGCIDTLRKNIYTTVPNFTADKSSVCRDSLIVYNVNQSYPVNAGYTYDYYVNNDTISDTTTTVLNYNPANHGIYTDYVVIKDTLPGTCSDTLYLGNTTRVKGPVAAFTSASGVCADTAISFTNMSYPFYPNEPITSWKWTFGDNKSDSTMNPTPHLFPSRGGTYTVTLLATDVNGCGNKISKPIVIRALPVIRVLPKSDTLCSGQSLELIAYSVDNVTWSPNNQISCINCDTVTVSPITSVDYVALATTIFNCKKTDTAFIKVISPFNLVVSPADTAICPGDSVAYMLNKNGIVTWTPSLYLNNAGIFNPVSKPLDDIMYQVAVTDSFGCFTDTAFATINLYDAPTVNAGPDLQIDFNKPFTFNPVYTGNIQSYLWSPGQELDCRTCPTASGIAKAPKDYIIKITDINGCRAADTVSLKINCLNSQLYMPSAFTPNGDGLNDFYFPLAQGGQKIKSFVIFNRYGVKVFERQNLEPNIASLGWDGKLQGFNELNTQSFVWMAETICNGQVVLHKGNVLLIR